MAANRSPLTISPGQALLILIDKYKLDAKKQKRLKELYFIGAINEDPKAKAEQGPVDAAAKAEILELLKDDVLRLYHVSTEKSVINNDPTRRYFESQLAHTTLGPSVEELDEKDVEAHHKALLDLIKGLPKTSKIADDFMNCRFTDLLKNPDLNAGDKTNIKEYSEMLAKLNPKYAALKLKSENEMRKKLQHDINLLRAENAAKKPPKSEKELNEEIKKLKEKHGVSDKPLDEKILDAQIKNLEKSDTTTEKPNEYSKYSQKNKHKLELIALCSFISTLIGKDVTLPIDIYGKEYYKAENRGQVPKADQQEVRSQAMGIMKSYMPIPRGDSLEAFEPASYSRPADRFNYNPRADWVVHNFNFLVHPFSCAISGTMLIHLRVFKALAEKNKLSLNNLNKLASYLKVLIPFLMYNSGGHSIHEFTYPLRLSPIKESFKFIDGFETISSRSLFLEKNKAISKEFDLAIEKAIHYNKMIIAKANLNIPKAALHRELMKRPKHDKKHDISQMKKMDATPKLKK